jgi:hypothetical protein
MPLSMPAAGQPAADASRGVIQPRCKKPLSICLPWAQSGRLWPRSAAWSSQCRLAWCHAYGERQAVIPRCWSFPFLLDFIAYRGACDERGPNLDRLRAMSRRGTAGM